MSRAIAFLGVMLLLAACADRVAVPTEVSVPRPVAAVVEPGACTFAESGTTWTLQADCTTTETIVIPDGFTLDGKQHMITVPIGTDFFGAVIRNGGGKANVVNVAISAGGLVTSCHASSPTDTRLRAILFNGASGRIANNTVWALNQNASGCQEGNAIEVRNAPFDGTHPNTQVVEIDHNVLLNWQKTGIVTNGDVSASVHHNQVGESALQRHLAANSIQVGFGAQAIVAHNQVEGNEWIGFDWWATAILVYEGGEGVVVRDNNISGNSNVGIDFETSSGIVDNNRVFDEREDLEGYDIGIFNYGTDNKITNNKVRGFLTPLEGVTGGRNKTIPSPKPIK